MARVLYLAAGNPLRPSSGMDMVARSHFDELVSTPGIDISAIFSAPAQPSGHASQAATQWAGSQVYFGEPKPKHGKLRRALSLLMDLSRFRFVQYRDFVSSAAEAAIRAALNETYDCVVIDHFVSMTNVPLLKLIRLAFGGRTRLVFVAHNVTPRSMWDTVRLTPSLSGKAIFAVQAAQALLLEVMLLRLMNESVFISAYDCATYGRLAGGRAMSLFPLLTRVASAGQTCLATPQQPYIVFVGSPKFPPNRFAIDWICGVLAPRLLQRAPGLTVVLVGGSTDSLNLRGSPNVAALGFVEEATLGSILRGSNGLICPVIHGSGIKIKIADAIQAGCPILATSFSLHGFEFMGITPQVFIEDPDRTVECIVSSTGFDAIAEAQRQISDRWAQYVAFRRGRLAQVVGAISALSSRPDGTVRGARA